MDVGFVLRGAVTDDPVLSVAAGDGVTGHRHHSKDPWRFPFPVVPGVRWIEHHDVARARLVFARLHYLGGDDRTFRDRRLHHAGAQPIALVPGTIAERPAGGQRNYESDQDDSLPHARIMPARFAPIHAGVGAAGTGPASDPADRKPRAAAVGVGGCAGRGTASGGGSPPASGWGTVGAVTVRGWLRSHPVRHRPGRSRADHRRGTSVRTGIKVRLTWRTGRRPAPLDGRVHGGRDGHETSQVRAGLSRRFVSAFGRSGVWSASGEDCGRLDLDQEIRLAQRSHPDQRDRLYRIDPERG